MDGGDRVIEVAPRLHVPLWAGDSVPRSGLARVRFNGEDSVAARDERANETTWGRHADQRVVTRQHAIDGKRERGVRLRTLIGEIGAKYDRQLPTSSEAQLLLRRADVELRQWIPAEFRIEGRRGKSAVTPRIRIFAGTETTRSGIHIAYLFAADMSTVTLSLTQGIAEIADLLGRAKARRTLAWEAADIRAALRSHGIADLDITLNLGSTAASSVDYQRTNILSRTYRLDALPNEPTMVADLQRFIRLYGLALKARGRAIEPGTLASPTPARRLAQAKKTAAAGKPADRKGSAEITEVTVPAPQSHELGRRPSGQANNETKAMTRRGLLAALVAVPAAFIAPAAFGRDDNKKAGDSPAPQPALTPPLFTIDVSHHDWDRRGGNLDWSVIRNAGIAGMCARASYGDPSGFNYRSYHFGEFAHAARDAGMVLRGGYHNLIRGDQASINRQVDWLRQELDAYDANWAMLDIERYAELVSANLWPRWDDVRRFDDRWAAVDDRVLVGYLPPWNWRNHLGKPDLRAFRGPLVASDYPLSTAGEYRQLYVRCGGDKGRGWTSYGNRVSEGWQFSSRAKVPGAAAACGINAWRMTFDQLHALLV